MTQRSPGQLLSAALGLLLSLGFLWLLLRDVDVSRVSEHLKRVDLGRLSLAMLSVGLSLVVLALRLGVFVRPLGEGSLKDYFATTMVGFAGNNVLPLRLGDVLRMTHLSRRTGVDLAACVAAVAGDRIVDALCLCVVMLVALAGQMELNPDPTTASVLVLFTLGVTALVMAVARQHARIERRLLEIAEGRSGWSARALSFARRFLVGLGAFRSARTTGAAVGWGLSYWGLAIVGVQIYLWAFRFDLPWHAAPLVVFSVGLSLLLPSTPSGIGTSHYFITLALMSLGVDKFAAVSAAIVIHAAGVIPFTVVGMWWLMPELMQLFRLKRREGH